MLTEFDWCSFSVHGCRVWRGEHTESESFLYVAECLQQCIQEGAVLQPGYMAAGPCEPVCYKHFIFHCPFRKYRFWAAQHVSKVLDSDIKLTFNSQCESINSINEYS